MAKLGGIKFGAAPQLRKPVPSAADGDTPRSPVRETIRSPTGEAPPLSPLTETTAAPQVGGTADESPEQEAARRRATLARLRAGGTLGFGMFNHGPAAAAEPEEDQRGIEAEPEEEEVSAPAALPVPPSRPAPAEVTHSDDEASAPPPVPGGRPPVPGNRPIPPPPVMQPQEDEDEEEELPPPPPPVRQPSMLQARPLPPMQTSPHDGPPSPIRSPSGRRPPIPTVEKRLSQSSLYDDRQSLPRQSLDSALVEEPGAMQPQEEAYEGDEPPPPPPNLPVQGGMPQPISTGAAAAAPSHRRSMSTASRSSRLSDAGVPQFSPASRQASRQDSLPPTPVDAGRQSMTGGTRPAFNALQDASREIGARLASSARSMFSQGKRGNYGVCRLTPRDCQLLIMQDGSPAGFVIAAIDAAQLPRPQGMWGQVVFEQEAASILKRYDEVNMACAPKREQANRAAPTWRYRRTS